MKSINLGISLFEMVIVVALFAMVAVLTTRSTFLTLRGGRKSEAQIKVKENLEHALSVMDRGLRNADLVSDCGESTTRINYTDSEGVASYFGCQSIGQTSGYVASGSARLTSSDVSVTNCSITCTPAEGTVPVEITIDLSAKELTSPAAEDAEVTTSTRIILRNY